MADRPASRPLTRGGPLPPGPRGCGPGDTHVFRRRRRRRFPSLWLGCPQAGRSALKRIAIVEAGRQPLDRLRLLPGHLHRDRLGAGVCDQSLEALLSALARVLHAAERKLDAAAGAARRGHAGTGRGRQARATTTLGRTRRDRPGTLLMDPLTSGGARARPGHGRAALRRRPAPASAGASPVGGGSALRREEGRGQLRVASLEPSADRLLCREGHAGPWLACLRGMPETRAGSELRGSARLRPAGGRPAQTVEDGESQSWALAKIRSRE
jgi:hypothetical protein